jgi:hypothetical protein
MIRGLMKNNAPAIGRAASAVYGKNDSELRLLAAVRWSIREHGGEASSHQVDELLDERLARRGRAGEDAAVDT